MKLKRYLLATVAAGAMAGASAASAAPTTSLRVPKPATEAGTIALLGHTPWVSAQTPGLNRHFLWKVPSAMVTPVKDEANSGMVAAGGSLWTFHRDVTYQRNVAGKVVWSGRLPNPDGANTVSYWDGIAAGPGAFYVADVLGLYRVDTKTRQVTQVGTGQIHVPAVAADGTVWGVQPNDQGWGALVFRPDGTTARFGLSTTEGTPIGEGAVAADGSYWLAWDSGVVRVGVDGVVTFLDRGHRYTAVVAAPDGSIWTGRRDGRVLRYAAAGGTGKVRGKAPSGQVAGIVIDGRRVWVLHTAVTDVFRVLLKPAGVFTLKR